MILIVGADDAGDAEEVVVVAGGFEAVGGATVWPDDVDVTATLAVPEGSADPPPPHAAEIIAVTLIAAAAAMVALPTLRHKPCISTASK